MAEIERPLLNPVLSLRILPKRNTPPGRGKEAKQIVTPRLLSQRQSLSSQMNAIFRRRGALPIFGGKVQLFARMFSDSLATTYTPGALFLERMGMRLVAPFKDGYLIEANVDSIPGVAGYIQTSDSIGSQVDI